MRENFEELVGAVVAGKRLEYRGEIGVAGGVMGEWVPETAINVAAVVNQLLYWKHLEYRVKPEKKTLKYETRPFYNRFGVGLWNSLERTQQEIYEDTYTELKWLAPTTFHEIEV